MNRTKPSAELRALLALESIANSLSDFVEMKLKRETLTAPEQRDLERRSYDRAIRLASRGSFDVSHELVKAILGEARTQELEPRERMRVMNICIAEQKRAIAAHIEKEKKHKAKILAAHRKERAKEAEKRAKAAARK